MLQYYHFPNIVFRQKKPYISDVIRAKPMSIASVTV